MSAAPHAPDAAKSSSRPYITITADTHAGASIETCRGDLDRRWRARAQGAMSKRDARNTHS